MSARIACLALLSTVGCTWPASAQGLQTGVITGIVASEDNVPLPGVTVTAASQALLGERTTVTDVNGVYALKLLPPGDYEVVFDLQDFASVRRDLLRVSTGGTLELSVIMVPATRNETIVVTAAAPLSSATAVTGQSVTKRDVDAMPIGRRPVDIAEFAPGVTTNTFTVGQLAIAGAFGYDNVFMVDGVDVNDTVTGTANNLFIEDAIQDTSVLVHGIPAEYGRFSGGVINVITRSGGERFTGSGRVNLSNPAWIQRTPLQQQNGVSNPDILGTASEGTFGGPLMRNRAWFFTAGRWEKTTAASTFTQTGAAYTRTDTNRRGELKLTGRMRSSDTLQGTFVNNSLQQTNSSAIAATRLVDASTLVNREFPNKLFTADYNGLVGQTFVTARYSQKRQQYLHNGGSGTSLTDSPFRTLGVTAGVPASLVYHAPYFDATDPEQRNNRQVTGSVSHLLSATRAGTHDLKGGVEFFDSIGIGGNSQSSTGWVFATDYAVNGGVPVVDAAGAPVPRFIPGVTEAWTFQATRGARIDIKTTSLYAQDRWTVNRRLTLDLGARYEAVRSDATGDITAVDTSTVVPRLAGVFDVRGNGRTAVRASYGHYSGKYGQAQFTANSNVGRPSEIDYVYSGPAGQGSTFGPGFDRSNYTAVIFANFPTANVKVARGLRSPITREFTLGASHRGGHGEAQATYAWRRTSNVVEDFLDLSTGFVDVPLVGPLTTRLIANSDVPTHAYQALIVQGSYAWLPRVSAGAHYTLELENDGDFVGEAAGQPGISSIYGNFPEVFAPALDRLMPDGRLDNFQRHKLRVYGIYSQSWDKFGSFDLSPIWRVASGTVYSLTAAIPIPAAQIAHNPGYPSTDINPFVRETAYFGERGAYEFKGYGVVDLAATYRVAVWKSAAPWFKVEIYNLFGNRKQIAWDRTVTADLRGPLDANGIPVNYNKGPRFGTATSDTHFPQPFAGQTGGRAARLAFGVRF